MTDPKDMGVPASPSGSRPTDGAEGVSPADAASIPNADDLRFLGAGPDPRGGFTFSFADPKENGVIRIIAEHLYEMMGIGTKHELNCVQIEIKPRDFGQALSLTMQKEGGKTPLALKAEAVRLLQQTLAAIETGRHEPLAIMRDTIRNWLEDDITASAMSAGTAETAKQAQGQRPASAVGNAETPKDHSHD